MSEQDAHVIVGAGLAGAKAAEALRDEGFDGRIVLLGDELEQPYERPPLSKDYLRGESPREKAHVTPATGPSRSPTATSSATTGCCLPPARSRGGCPFPGPSSTASTTCAS